jgi:hypothetical protein
MKGFRQPLDLECCAAAQDCVGLGGKTAVGRMQQYSG